MNGNKKGITITGIIVAVIIAITAFIFIKKPDSVMSIIDHTKEYNAGNTSGTMEQAANEITAEQIRKAVYEQVKTDIENGEIILPEGDTEDDYMSEENIQIITDRVLLQAEKYGMADISEDQKDELSREITKNVSEQISSIVGNSTLSTKEKNAIISEVTKNVKSNTSASVSESSIRDIVKSIVNSMDLQGKKGDKGDTGATGAAGAAGKKGDDGDDGKDGKDGKNGNDGKDGKDGKTPVKGVDYLTDSDIDSMVTAVATEIINAGDITVMAKTAYDIAVDHGYQGTEEEWINSLGAVNEDDYEEIKERIIEIIKNEYQPEVKKESDGSYTLIIPTAAQANNSQGNG